MTQNQIAYWNYVENKRSHLADELERNRHNVANEVHDQKSLIEATRHNKNAEGAAYMQADAAQRKVDYEYPYEGALAAGDTVGRIIGNVGRVVQTVGNLFS